MNSRRPMDHSGLTRPRPLRWVRALSFAGGWRGSSSLCRTLYMPLSAVISHQQLAMSYSPQALGFFDLTFRGTLNPMVPVLFWSLYFSGNPGLDVPTRAAYSHSASVGRRTVFLFFSDRMAQNLLMSVKRGFCTGSCGSFTVLGLLPITASYISWVTGISAR